MRRWLPVLVTTQLDHWGWLDPRGTSRGSGQRGGVCAEGDGWGKHVDVAHRGVGVVGHRFGDGVLFVAADVGGIDQAQRLVPHGVTGEANGDMPAAAFGLLLDQPGRGAEGAHVAGDEVVDRPVGGSAGVSGPPSRTISPEAAEPFMSKPPRRAHGPLDP